MTAKRHKVLFISTGLKPIYGGTAFSESLLCSALKPLADVTVMVEEQRFDPMFVRSYGLNEIVTYRLPHLLAALAGRWSSIGQVIAEQDVVHLNGHWSLENFIVARYCWQHSIPYVLHPRGMLWMGYRSYIKKWLYNFFCGRRIVRRAAQVIALSHFEVEQFAPYGIKPERISVVPNPIVFSDLVASDKSSNPKSTYFLYLGRIEKRKNLIFLVEAFKTYVENGGQAQLYLAGPVERKYDREVWHKVLELDLKSRVKIMGPAYSDQKRDLIGNALGLVYPAEGESFGRVPFESVALGTFPIIPIQSGSSEYLKQFLPDCIYSQNDSKGLAAVLKQVETGSMINDSLAAARTWIEEKLKPAAISLLINRLYESVV